MTPAAFAVTALLAAQAPASPPPPATPPRATSPTPGAPGRAAELGTGDVHVEAGTVVYEPGRDRFRVEGGAVLRRGVIVLRARTAEVDRRTGEIHAAGGVLLTDATRVVSADALSATLGGPFEAENVTVFLKEGPVNLSEATDLASARRIGGNRLSFTASRVHGSGVDPEDRMKVLGARLTLCDCGEAAPTWSIHAREADVIPGRRATLTWPVLYVRPLGETAVPILVLPWLYLPLKERQTGVLLPVIDSTHATGFAAGLPIFVTLGESADLTLTPGWAFGPGGNRANGAVEGPTARLEARWAPAKGAEGEAEGIWVNDHIAEPGGASGARWGLTLGHVSGRQEGLALRADVALAEDGVLWRDLTTDAIARTIPYRRSSLLAAHLAGPVLVEAGAAYLQALQPDGASGPYGVAGSDIPLAQALPWASATLPASTLGPLLVSGRAGVASLAPVHGGADLAGRPDLRRVDARLQVEAPLVVGDVLSLSPFARGAALAYPGADGQGGVGWGVVGAALGSEISRAYGPLRHAIAARAEWRAGGGAHGDVPTFPAYDLYDRVDTGTGPGDRVLTAAPAGPFQQLRLVLDTRLSRGGTTLARLAAGQDLDLRAGRADDAFVSGALDLGVATADFLARFRGPGAPEREPGPAPPSPLDHFSELKLGLNVGSPRGTGLHASLVSFGTHAPGVELSGIDTLFDPRAVTIGPISQARAGARLALGAGTLGYDVTFPARDGVTTVICGDSTRVLGAFTPQQHVATLTWESPCKCFGALLKVSVDACGSVGYHAQLDLAHLGERARLH